MGAVTLKDIARKLDISEATCSQALNNYPGISEKTRQKVLACAQEMDYVPNPIARGLATKRTMTIGCICPDPENPSYSRFIKKISTYCESFGYSLILTVSDNNKELEAKLVKQLINCCVDGLIISPIDTKRNDSAVFQTLKEGNIPYVFSMSYYEGFEDEAVIPDYFTGSYDATKALLDNGCDSIWYLVAKEEDIPVSKLRIEGWKQAYADAGKRWLPEWIIPCEYMDSRFAYYITKRILDRRRPPCAICTQNDYMATGVRQAIADSGYQVPQDISLVGYDDVMDNYFMDVPLTTVRLNIDLLAWETVRFLMQKISGKEAEPPVQRLIPTKLIIRKTTQFEL